uniref:Uncharacterized protein n=1 Tax=Anguilla anguilla TaxID=7936 RepID=A0A0E9QFY6_ANGAN
MDGWKLKFHGSHSGRATMCRSTSVNQSKHCN